MKKIFIVFLVLLSPGVCYLIAGALSDARRADAIWRQVRASAREVSSPAYDPRPASEIIRKFHGAVIGTGAGMFRGVELEMDGEFRLGDSWVALEARQVLVPGKGFVWKAKVGSGVFVIKGFDAYFSNSGSVNFRLWGLVPIVTMDGPDITRAAKGRLLAETTLVPGAFFGLYGKRLKTVGPRRIGGEVDVDGETTVIEIGIGNDGDPTEVVILRWGDVNPEKRFTYLPFGIGFLKTATIDGCTVPVEMAGGWNYGIPAYEETIRLRFTGVRFF